MELRVREVVEATRGELLQGDPEEVVHGVWTDSRTLPPGVLFFALKGSRFDGHDFAAEAVRKGAKALVIHRDVELEEGVALIKTEDTLRALGDLARWWRSGMKGEVIGITGSCGKTTTKEMVARILQQRGTVASSPGNYNNLIGLPLSLLRAPREVRAMVLEMGMSRPGEIARLSRIARPTVGVITNVGPVHLEGLSSLEAVRDAKGELLEGMADAATLVYNADDPLVAEIASRYRGRKLPFGKEKGVVRALKVAESDSGLDLEVLTPKGELSVELKILGDGAVYAALAATATALAAGASPSEVREGLRDFEPLEGRMKFHKVGPFTVIDDSYNSKPLAVQAALKVLGSRQGGRKIAVLGDMAELGRDAPRFHREVGKLCADLGLDALFLLGPLAQEIASGAKEGGLRGEVYIGSDHGDIAKALKGFLRAGDWVLIKGSRVMEMERVLDALRKGEEER